MIRPSSRRSNAKVDATFNGAKLEQVAEWIRHTCGIPVHVDAIVPASVADGPIFTLKASGVSLTCDAQRAVAASQAGLHGDR